MGGLLYEEAEIGQILKSAKRPVSTKFIEKELRISMAHVAVMAALDRMHKKHTAMKMRHPKGSDLWADPEFGDLRLLNRNGANTMETTMGHAFSNAKRAPEAIETVAQPKKPDEHPNRAPIVTSQQLTDQMLMNEILAAMVADVPTATTTIVNAIERRCGKVVTRSDVLDMLKRMSKFGNAPIIKTGHLRSTMWTKRYEKKVVIAKTEEQVAAEKRVASENELTNITGLNDNASDVPAPTGAQIDLLPPHNDTATTVEEMAAEEPTQEVTSVKRAVIRTKDGTEIHVEQSDNSRSLDKFLSKFPDYSAMMTAEVQVAWLNAFAAIAKRLTR